MSATRSASRRCCCRYSRQAFAAARFSALVMAPSKRGTDESQIVDSAGLETNARYCRSWAWKGRCWYASRGLFVITRFWQVGARSYLGELCVATGIVRATRS